MDKSEISVPAEELVGRLISVVMFNEATRHILNLPRDTAKKEEANRVALYEISLLALYAVMTTCLGHPLFKNNKEYSHKFADLIQEAFLLFITEKDKSEIRTVRIENISKDFVYRWDKYNTVINQIDSHKDNEKYVIEFEKIVDGFLGNNETSEEIKTRLDKNNRAGWHLFMHLRAYDTKRILDKYDIVLFG